MAFAIRAPSSLPLVHSLPSTASAPHPVSASFQHPFSDSRAPLVPTLDCLPLSDRTGHSAFLPSGQVCLRERTDMEMARRSHPAARGQVHVVL